MPPRHRQGPWHLWFGRAGERRAKRYLSAQGLHFVCANFCCPLGEVDLIMRDGDCLVFVEVKTRNTSAFGGAVSAYTEKKRRNLTRAANVYMQQQGLNPHHQSHRYDLVAVEANKVQWFTNT